MIFFIILFHTVFSIQSSWTDANGDVSLVFNHQTKLYSDRFVKTCDVYDQVCIGRKCVHKWDGAEHSVFQLSASTCAGYELGMIYISFSFRILLGRFRKTTNE